MLITIFLTTIGVRLLTTWRRRKCRVHNHLVNLVGVLSRADLSPRQLSQVLLLAF